MFQALKDLLCVVPVLVYPVPEEKLILGSNATDMELAVYFPKWLVGLRKS